MISDKSKAIKKSPNELFFRRLYKKHGHLISEYKQLRDSIKAAEREKSAAEERIKSLIPDPTILLDVESAGEETETEQEEIWTRWLL